MGAKQTSRWRLAQHENSPGGYVPCHYCATPLTINSSTVDHKQPVSKGGRNFSTNFLICCRLCNQTRGDMDYEEFKERWKELRDARSPKPIPVSTPRPPFQKTIGLYRRGPDETPEWSAPIFPTK